MIIPDVNVLIYAYNSSATEHRVARAWWERTLTEGDPVGLPWAVLLGFVRLCTNRHVMKAPVDVAQVRAIIDSWLERPGVVVLTPGTHHAATLFDLLEGVGTGGDLTTDAHIAALAVEYRAEVATTDADFLRFRYVRSFNPLAGRSRRR